MTTLRAVIVAAMCALAAPACTASPQPPAKVGAPCEAAADCAQPACSAAYSCVDGRCQEGADMPQLRLPCFDGGT